MTPTLVRQRPRRVVAQEQLSKTLRVRIPLTLMLVATLVPLYWLVMYAFRAPGGAGLLPWPVTTRNFSTILESLDFGRFLINSAVVGVGTVVATIIVALMGAYAISRFSFRGRRWFFVMLLCTQFVPGAMLLIPLFEVFDALGLLNSLTGLVVANTVFQLPLGLLLMSSFISAVPVELEEAAWVDGCSRLHGFVRVVLPLLGPGLIAVGSFTFIGAWNNFLFSLMFINRQELFTVPVGLSYLVGEYSADYGALAAGGLVSILPVILVFAFVQRYLVQGMAVGAVKG